MTDRIWLRSYPKGVAADINVSVYTSLVALMEESFTKYADRVAYNFMGKDISYAHTDSLSQAFAGYLQSLGLAKGDRVAIMMPNVPQYPVAVAAILRAGFVVVNVNPLYTPRELEHQLKDSGAKAIVIIENFATTLEKCLSATPVKHVVLCAMGDQLGLLKGALVNYVVRNVKKMVPAYTLPGAVRFNAAIATGTKAPFNKPDIKADDVAVLQYTGGTTGASQFDCQCAAVRGVERPRDEQDTGQRTTYWRVRTAPVPYFCLHCWHDVVNAHGWKIDPDSKPQGHTWSP